jgi:hypothetical protein
MNIYNTQIAGLMGVYLLGRMHGEKDKKWRLKWRFFDVANKKCLLWETKLQIT